MGLFHLIKEAVMKMLNLKEIKKLGADLSSYMAEADNHQLSGDACDQRVNPRRGRGPAGKIYLGTGGRQSAS